MKEYILNFALNALVAWVIATLTFLISGEFGVFAVAAACVGGIAGGIFSGIAYVTGRMKGGLRLDWTLVAVTAVAAIVGGLVGGLQMLL